MDKIIFVTAYKDIGRELWYSCSRTNNEYFEYFHNLTQNIEYKLAVFVEKEIEHELKIRYTFNDNIIFIDLNLVNTFLCQFLSSQKVIMNSEIYKNKIPDDRKLVPEHFCAEYNLINHSKINFVSYTKNIYPNYKFYSWIDFGFVRNNLENVPRNINISLLPEDKIVYQIYDKIDDRKDPNFMLGCHTIFFIGSSNIIPNSLVERFEDLYRNKIIELEQHNIVDDDQALILQIYYDNPELFTIFQSKNWFSFYRHLQI